VQNVDLNEVAVFVRVAQVGSFTQAARQLNMPNSTVSAWVSSLERRLGVTLMKRTTRKLNLTQAGRSYYERCLVAIAEIQSAESVLVSEQAEPQGNLKITAPLFLGSSLLPKIVADYMVAYPKVGVEIVLSDQMMDLVSENIDLAIRAGELKDSGLIAKKLGLGYFAPFASSDYIKTHGAPSHPKDIGAHSCIQFTHLGRDRWEFTNRRRSVTVSLPGKILVDDLGIAKSLALAGRGIALLPTFACESEAEDGGLVRLLPGWYSNARPIHFAYVAQRFVAPKVKAFISLATEPLKAYFKELEI
jgi:DNA-binding transcriptional LysR family regulator